MYASQMQNVSAGRFLYGTGEEHTIRLLLKSKDSIANIFLNNRQSVLGEAFALALKKCFIQRDLLSSLHLLFRHICSMVYSKPYILIWRSLLVAEKVIIFETISFIICSLGEEPVKISKQASRDKFQMRFYSGALWQGSSIEN